MLFSGRNPNELVEALRAKFSFLRDDPEMHSMAYCSRYAVGEVPKYNFPNSSTPANAAYQLVHDQLELDGKPYMNCASFVNTWMEEQAKQLIMENINKNLADQDEYPACQVVQGRCVSYLADLWKVPKGHKAVGTAVVGSSEGIMLGGLALKWRWRKKRQQEGKDTSKPNIVLGANAQVALEKFARYFDVEARLIPVSEATQFTMDPQEALKHIDENTIGIYVILGSTYTGHFEPVEEISEMLDDLQQRTGLDIPIHVDGASGAMLAPFVFPQLKWSFEVPRVASINTSGHKFGLCYPGLGWVMWRDESYLPADLIFELHYLGGAEDTYTLNFSRPSCFVVAQYYNFIRLGREGYRRIHANTLANARFLSRALEAVGVFEVISDIHRPRGDTYHDLKQKRRASLHVSSERPSGTSDEEYHKMLGKARKVSLAGLDENIALNSGLPVVTFKFSPEFQAEYPHVTQETLSLLLRVKGWIVPNYELPPHCEKTQILRVVVREGMSSDMIEELVQGTVWAISLLTDTKGPGAVVLESQQPQAITETATKPGVRHTADGTPIDPSRSFRAQANWQKAFAWARQNYLKEHDHDPSRCTFKHPAPTGDNTEEEDKRKPRRQRTYSLTC
ncbi:glutamate decarboxylase gad1 [Dispira simplex]|nr:glutamate decarboxylase gad1 [Dispira simplex]